MPLDGGGEDALDAAQILEDLLDLLGDIEKKVQVFLFVAPEVMHAHVPNLPVAGHAPVPLLDLRWRPGDVVVNDPATRLLHVDAFRGGIGRQEQTNRSGGVLELGLDCLELVKVHAAVEQSERVLVEPFLKQTLLQVEQCLLVLGEDDQPLVVPQLASRQRGSS